MDSNNKKSYEVHDTLMPQELVDAMVSIEEMTDDIVRAIPEEDFRKKYLPMFMSDKKGVDLSPWLDVAGTAYESVNVVKDGRVVFVVPPLVRRHPTLINVDSRISAATISAEAIQHTQRHPQMGINHLVRHFEGKVVHSGISPEEIKQWNTILAYYNYPLIGDGATSEVGDKEPEPEFGVDDYEEM